MAPEGTLDIIFFLIGGLGLFLFGMRVMSDALRRVAGDRMRRILRMFTRTVPIAVLAGAAVTCLIQSSSATTVMVVGFVNAGLMELSQAIGVIMGANIGTTLTAWLVSGIGLLKITNYALPAIGIGLLMNMVGKRRWKHWGSVVLGFGLLFFGLSLMKDAFEPLRHSEQFKTLMARFAANPLSGVLIGTVLTMVIQSSSATIAIAQMLALSGILTFPQALPLVLGDNIGTTITAQIASVGTNVNAKRAARAHMMFNLFGVCLVLPFVWMGVYSDFIEFIIPGRLSESTVMLHIAVSHSFFNVINTLVFIPLAGGLAAVSRRLVPGEAGFVRVEPQYLEEHLLETPSIALEQARREVIRMLELAASATKDAADAFFTGDGKRLQLVAQKEEAIDNLQNKITQYLIQISQRDLEPSESNELPVLLHSVNDIERMGDHAVNLGEAAQRKHEDDLPFTDMAMEELRMMRSEVEAMYDTVIRALRDSDLEAAKDVLESEEKLNGMGRQFRESHLRRLAEGECNFYSGLTFVDCVYNYEKIGDHLLNTAQAVLGDFQWGEKVRSAAGALPPTAGAPPGDLP
jgi:phosphate:Na+ symporter